MSMHLHHPALSLNGKKKGRVKFKSADAKREHDRLEQEWKDLLKRQGAELEAKRQHRALSAEPLTYKLSAPAGRGNTRHIPSLNSGAGVATLAPAKVWLLNIAFSCNALSCVSLNLSHHGPFEARSFGAPARQGA